jgi:hypoxanthine phosphoribosyltransferase
MTAGEARRLLAEAEVVCPAERVAEVVEQLAGEITRVAGESYPLVLTVMGGAVVFAGQLLPKLAFPLECDYIHATRYGTELTGSALHWLVEPRQSVVGRTVLVLDDILDEGVTLAAIKARILEQGAAQCLLAVLAEKELGRAKPVAADFVGVRLPNRFLFGCGMDARGAWRNLPAIYAVRDT